MKTEITKVFDTTIGDYTDQIQIQGFVGDKKVMTIQKVGNQFLVVQTAVLPMDLVEVENTLQIQQKTLELFHDFCEGKATTGETRFIGKVV